ncbi:hypothetical protein [Sphingopyxis sp. R3-92]|uniref:hypothetical protein n=1 Tax=Sphingopyxis sp. R3-92 TaxID=3158553 RepID=UPI003EE68EF4
MRNIISLCAAALALASPGIAQADTFGPNNGTYTFAGAVTVQKNLSPATSCNLSLGIVVTGAGTGTNAANVTAAAGSKPVLTGGPICTALTFSNLPYSVDAVNTDGVPTTAEELWMSTVRVDIPPLGGNPADACQGVLKVYWLPGSPPQIEFDSPFSDIPGVSGPPPCKIIGTLTQTSGPGGANLVITP